MDEIAPTPEQPDQPQSEPEAPQIPSEPATPINSRFLFVDVAALRAKQLRRGARPRLTHDLPQGPHKAERVAMEEVRSGLVYYDVAQPPPPPPDEAREA
jgi:DNA-directed RNA polymerase subunit K/omega